jgi:hypothetical protein
LLNQDITMSLEAGLALLQATKIRIWGLLPQDLLIINQHEHFNQHEITRQWLNAACHLHGA